NRSAGHAISGHIVEHLVEIPIVRAAAPVTRIPRFLPWRLSDDGPSATGSCRDGASSETLHICGHGDYASGCSNSERRGSRGGPPCDDQVRGCEDGRSTRSAGVEPGARARVQLLAVPTRSDRAPTNLSTAELSPMWIGR